MKWGRKEINEHGTNWSYSFSMEVRLSYGIERKKCEEDQFAPTSASLFTYCFSIFFPSCCLCIPPSFPSLLHLVSLQLHLHPSSYHHIPCNSSLRCLFHESLINQFVYDKFLAKDWHWLVNLNLENFVSLYLFMLSAVDKYLVIFSFY